MPGPDELLAEFMATGEEAAPPRMQRARRTVLDEVQVSPDRVSMGRGGRVEMGDEIDADAPLAKAPAEAPSPEVGSALEEAARRRQETAFARAPGSTRSRAEVAEEASRTSPLWDAMLGAGDFTRAGDRAAARSRERLAQYWDQFTSGDERLGGRNPITPIVGHDVRGLAPSRGASSALLLGEEDELAGLTHGAPGTPEYRAERDRMRADARRTREQAPEAYASGEVAGTLPWMALPGAGQVEGAGLAARTALAAGQGAQLGAMGAFGASEGDIFESPEQVATDTIGGGLAGGTMGGGAELGVGALGAMSPARLRQAASRADQGAEQARLEASGFWGSRAAQAVDDLPGGRERFVGDLRRYQVGERGLLSVPRADRAADDLDRLRRAGGSSMEAIAQRIDDSGARVDLRNVASQVEQSAADLERMPSSTARRAAQRLRDEFAPMLESGDVSFSDAWRMRRFLDDLGAQATRGGDADLATAAGRFGRIRQALHGEMDSAASHAGLGAQWADASRTTQLGIVGREVGQGAQRLSVGGGMGGAQAAGDLAAAAAMGEPMAALAQMPARAIAQGARMRYPGLAARAGEGRAAMLRGGAQFIEDVLQSQPERLGRFAQPLAEAAARGSAALTTTTYVLAQRDAEFRRLMDELQAMPSEEEMFPGERAVVSGGM